jgi:hypothetical protein
MSSTEQARCDPVLWLPYGRAVPCSGVLLVDGFSRPETIDFLGPGYLWLTWIVREILRDTPLS